MKYLRDNLWIQLVILFLVTLSAAKCVATKDSTDPENGVSGMSLYTDALTDCQYLSTPFGSLTPRLDRSGKQICSTTEFKRMNGQQP